MAKRFFLLLTLGFILLVFSIPVLAVSEEAFWETVLKGDYLQAGEMAKEIGASLPEYYSLAAICFLNQSKYDDYRIYKNRFERSGNPEKLRELLQNREGSNQEEPRILLLEGMIISLFAEAKPGEARVILKKAEPGLTNDPYLYNYLALSEMSNRNYSLTVQKYLRKAIGLKKDFPEAYTNLAAVLIENKENEKAIAVLLDCLVNCPQIPGNTYESLIKLTGTPVSVTIKPFGEPISVTAPVLTEPYFSKIKTTLRPTPKKLLDLAEILIKKGNADSARALLEKVNFEGWESLYLYLQLQLAHLDGDYEQVVAAGNTLSEENELDYYRLYEAGNIFFYAKEFKLAEQFYERALTKANPEDHEYLIEINANLGACFYFLKDYTFARICFEKALSFDPEDTFSLANLGLIYRDLGERQKAAEYLTKALAYIHDPEWRREIEGILSELE